MFSRKEKVYPFKSESISKIKADKLNAKIDTIISVSFYILIAVLLLRGTIGQKFMINMTVGKITSKTVKVLMGN